MKSLMFMLILSIMGLAFSIAFTPKVPVCDCRNNGVQMFVTDTTTGLYKLDTKRSIKFNLKK